MRCDPSWVAATAARLYRATRYLFVSSVSVYDATGTETGNGSPLARMPPEAIEGDDAAYGPVQIRCEDAARAVFGPDRTIAIRPGLIVGPYDPTNRFTYWVDRGAEGGTILAPRSPADVVQYIDVRDLATFVVDVVRDGRSGIYDVTGASERNDAWRSRHGVRRPRAAPAAGSSGPRMRGSSRTA